MLAVLLPLEHPRSDAAAAAPSENRAPAKRGPSETRPLFCAVAGPPQRRQPPCRTSSLHSYSRPTVESSESAATADNLLAADTRLHRGPLELKPYVQ